MLLGLWELVIFVVFVVYCLCRLLLFMGLRFFVGVLMVVVMVIWCWCIMVVVSFFWSLYLLLGVV